MKLKRAKPEPKQPGRVKAVDIVSRPETDQDDIPFNPERDITEQDWQDMKRQLEYYSQETEYQDFFELAMYMAVLFPEKRHELNIDEGTWEGMKGELEQEQRWHGYQVNFPELAVRMNLLSPERRGELKLDDAAWKGMKEKLDLLYRNSSWIIYSPDAVEMCLLFPERRHELNIDDTVWAGLKGELERRRGIQNWYGFSHIASDMVLLFPERRQELDIDRTNWQMMKRDLEASRQDSNWLFFSDLAMHMSIIAADKAEITEDGQIKLTVTKKLPSLASPHPLPPRPPV